VASVILKQKGSKRRKNNMPRSRILDVKLLGKIARKLDKKELRKINVMVSKKASKLGISPEAALVLLAKELDIGTATYQKKLEPNKQAEIRDSLPAIFTEQVKEKTGKKPPTYKTEVRLSRRTQLKAIIEYTIQDQELKDRCQDLLFASSKFDRPINQATLVLEDRIRKKIQPTQRLVGVDLVNYAFKGDLTRTILKVSDDPYEQDGFANILRGMMLAFRNPTHHYIINTFTRQDALKVCGFIDVLLKVVDNSRKIR